MPAAAPETITIDAAFQRLLSQRPGQPYDVCERMEAAIRAHDLFLFADGVEVSPDFFKRHHLQVAYDPTRRTAKIDMTSRAVVMPARWTIGGDIEKVAAKRAPHNAGGKREFDREWFLIEAAAFIVENDLPHSVNALCHRMQERLGDRAPGDTLGREILAPLWRRVHQVLGRSRH
jgi:hypothetical protein